MPVSRKTSSLEEACTAASDRVAKEIIRWSVFIIVGTIVSSTMAILIARVFF